MTINRRIFTTAKRWDPDAIVVTASVIAAAVVLVLDLLGLLSHA